MGDVGAHRTGVAARYGIVTDYPVSPSGPGRPARMWVAGELVAVVTEWAH